MLAALKIIFFVCLAPLAVLALYPAFAYVKSVLFRRKQVRSEIAEPVSIIIACKDEERYIRQKIESFLNPNEWIEGSELIVVSNGSADKTNSILREFENRPGVRVVIWEHTASKIISVNHAASIAKHNLLVFSDCRQEMKQGSVKALIRNFADESVGTVTATLDNSDGSNVTMRSLLNFIAQCESRSGSSLNVFGALYAQRKDVFRTIPTDLLFDDLFVIVSTLAQGKRLIAEKGAVIYDVDFHQYYGPNRLSRLARGLLLFYTNQRESIGKLSAGNYMRFMTFKYLKLIMPFFLLIAIAVGAYLTYVYGKEAYVLLGLGIFLTFCIYSPIRIAVAHFISVNLNFMWAVLRFYLRNDRSNQWDKLEKVSGCATP